MVLINLSKPKSGLLNYVWLWDFCEHFLAQCKFSASFSFAVHVCQSLKERKELKVMIWGLRMCSMSLFFLSGHPQTCWKVFIGRTRYNDTLSSIYLRLYLCSCVPYLCLGKEKSSLEGIAKPHFAVKFCRKTQAGHNVWVCGLKACHF